MASKNVFVKEAESMRDLRVLEEIDRNPGLSQREVADRLGVAVGIVNSCIRALARKGLVKVRGANNRSITYHLTKKGLLHKSKLAVEWTMNTIDFYRDARGKVASRLAAMAAAGPCRIVLLGTNELAEIAAIVSGEAGVTVVGAAPGEGVVAPPRLAGFAVASLADLVGGGVDAVVACIEPSEAQARAAADAGVPIIDLTGNTPWPFDEAKAVG